jgi:hypothetical protein
VIESSYDHKFTYTYYTQEKVEGETKQTKHTSDLNLCGFSQGSSSITTSPMFDFLKRTPKLFCNPSIEVNAGSIITVYKGDGTIALGVFTAGKSFIYNTHQEVPLLEDTTT